MWSFFFVCAAVILARSSFLLLFVCLFAFCCYCSSWPCTCSVTWAWHALLFFLLSQAPLSQAKHLADATPSQPISRGLSQYKSKKKKRAGGTPRRCACELGEVKGIEKKKKAATEKRDRIYHLKVQNVALNPFFTTIKKNYSSRGQEKKTYLLLVFVSIFSSSLGT